MPQKSKRMMRYLLEVWTYTGGESIDENIFSLINVKKY